MATILDTGCHLQEASLSDLGWPSPSTYPPHSNTGQTSILVIVPAFQRHTRQTKYPARCSHSPTYPSRSLYRWGLLCSILSSLLSVRATNAEFENLEKIEDTARLDRAGRSRLDPRGNVCPTRGLGSEGEMASVSTSAEAKGATTGRGAQRGPSLARNNILTLATLEPTTARPATTG